MNGGTKTIVFDWQNNPDSGGLRTKYRPKTRISSFFLTMVPWLDVLILGFAFVAFLHSKSIVPGEVVDLPSGVVSGGIAEGHVIIVRALKRSGASAETQSAEQPDRTPSEISLPKEIGVMIFFDDERFNMAYPYKIESFFSALRKKISVSGEHTALLYMDGGVERADAVRLNYLLRSAGIDRVCYVQKAEDRR